MKYYDTFISNTPEPYDRWHDAMQALIDKTFTNSSTYQKSGIEEEIAFGTLEFKPVICRVTTLIDATTGQRVNDDYRKIIFPDIKHCPELGTRYRFENNIWIVYSLENILTATSSVYVRRCNNTINTEDKYGNIHKEPCVIDYKINETQLQRSTEMEVPNSRLQVFCQDNVYSDRFSINNRFIFGSSVYKIRSRGDYDLRETFNSESQKIINFYIDLDNISDDDRFDLGIANYVEHNYTAIIPTGNIENVIGFTGKLNAQILLDGEETDEGDTHLKIFANPDFKGNVEIADLDYNDYETNGWKHHIIDLDKVKGANSIILSFQAITLDGTVPISLDNISVINRPEYALSAANLDMPVRLTVGKSVIAHGMVTNTGRKDITNYSVTLLKNGQPVDVKNDQRGIAAGESTSFDFNVTPSAVDANDTIDYSLKVESESSQTVSDTSTTVSVYIDDNKVPSINDLAGTETEDGVTLKWSTPTPERAAAITDDFDSYDPYLIEGFGDWTTVDGDGASTQYPAWAQITPNWKAPQAWQTFNWNQAGFNEGNYLSHSGEQSLVSWSATTNMWGVELCARNDNWLISPEVVPGSDIKLWMRGYEIDHLYGPEHFQILYSPESTDTTTFQLMAVDSLTSTKWRYFEYTLPRTAKYFAIRSITPERGFGIILDDLGYTPANGEAEALTLAHFNIYRDGKLIDTSLIPTFTDKPGDKANHSYQVSAVFEEGESALSNTYVYDVTNTIDKTTISGSSPVAVYGLDGRKVDRNQKGIVMIKKKNRSVVKELRQ